MAMPGFLQPAGVLYPMPLQATGYGQNMAGPGFQTTAGDGVHSIMEDGTMTITTDGYGYRMTNGDRPGFHGEDAMAIMDGHLFHQAFYSVQ